MATISAQLTALTTIKKLIEQHFPRAYYPGIEAQLQEYIDRALHQDIIFDEDRATYILKTRSVCKVCESEDHLIEVPTAVGSFHICRKCRKKIAQAETLAASLSA